ncbi:hypothetical protein GCM10025868_26690 [Angustibacter aerolatus]|uniref:Uncharacterized protein n=1 Tax=Angustibacter aerolatus TaxID=1162965 RepID=A0ABQ6JHV9_9ACTN|nr:hypothetical protein GCM10025868_26690 [Angustibacter aerolatus]
MITTSAWSGGGSSTSRAVSWWRAWSSTLVTWRNTGTARGRTSLALSRSSGSVIAGAGGAAGSGPPSAPEGGSRGRAGRVMPNAWRIGRAHRGSLAS